MPVARAIYRWETGRLALLLAGLLLGLGGCAIYAPRPLAKQADLAAQVPLRVDASTLSLPALRHHVFNPADGLDMTETAMLAVVNNPDLKVQRRKADVAHAQLFAARLLPDPQLSLSTDRPTDSGPGLTSAYGLGLNFDIAALVTRSARVDAASAGRQQVDLDMLWQEWQVVQQARLLYVQSLTRKRELDLLRQAQRLYADRYARSSNALRQGDLTLDYAGTDLTALLDAQTRVSQMERQLNRTRHDLNALLGLAPDVALNLAPMNEPLPPDAVRDATALKTIQQRRPDLLALQAGYRSQEAGVRRAILAQFPALSVGLTRARDTAGVHTAGFGVTLNLPLFSANRGEIAVQRATRDQMWQEYQSRLDQSYAQIDMLQKQLTLIGQRQAQMETNLPDLELMVQRAGRAYDVRDIDALTYLNMQATLMNKRIEAADLRQAQWDTRIALDTLLAWPDAETPPPAEDAKQ
ncbi:MAG: TolC family protein [Sulfuricaulis sp.]